MRALSDRLTQALRRAWSLLRSAPVILAAVLTASVAMSAARRAKAKAVQAARVSEADALTPTRKEVAAAKAEQRARMTRVIEHTRAASAAREKADQAAASLDAQGHTQVADLVRRWNRDQ